MTSKKHAEPKIYTTHGDGDTLGRVQYDPKLCHNGGGEKEKDGRIAIMKQREQNRERETSGGQEKRTHQQFRPYKTGVTTSKEWHHRALEIRCVEEEITSAVINLGALASPTPLYTP